MKKSLSVGVGLLVLASSAIALSSCGKNPGKTIVLWGPREHEDLYKEAMENYKKDHPDFEYDFEFQALGDAGANANIEKDVESAGSLITFPNDQLISIKRMGALSKLTTNDVTWAKEKHDGNSVESTKIGDGYYAYPISADNGFVFIYNKAAFVDTDVWDNEKDSLIEGYTFRDLFKALDDKGDKWASGGKVIWPLGSAWYEAGVFFGTGCDYSVEYDDKGAQKSVTCNIDDNEESLEAIRCMINTATNEDGTWNNHFVFTDDSDPAYNDYVTAHTGNGEKAIDEPLAGIISWNNSALRDAYGENYRVAVLPTLSNDVGFKDFAPTKKAMYTWKSFSGYKLLGVNPMSPFARAKDGNVEILHQVAQYLSDEAVSLLRYDATQMGPSNKAAAQSDKVKADKFLAALNEQFNLKDEAGNLIGVRTQDNTPSNFWEPIASVGKAIYESVSEGKPVLDSVANAKRKLKQVGNDIRASAE